MEQRREAKSLILIIMGCVSVNGYLNLFLNIHEVVRLLGVSAELYYVREGQVNNYALNFIVPVPANVHDIAFTWQSLAGRHLSYNIDITSANVKILPRPSLSIPQTGEIPTWVETFTVKMKCSTINSVEGEFTINIEVILNRALNNITKLVLHRKKICTTFNQSKSILEDEVLLESVEPPLLGIVNLEIGGILTLILMMTLVIIMYCTSISKKNKNRGQITETLNFQRLQTISFCKTYVSSTIMTPTHQTLKKNNEFQHSEELHGRINELTVERCRLRLSNLMQEGTFGRVYKGTYNENQDVLVKTVAQHANQVQVSLFLQEGMSLYGASHPGILSVLGVSIEDHTTPFVLYPILSNTHNLKMFLLEPSYARTVTSIQIVMISSQVSLALGHLHSHGVIHKDVAARNCVIDDNFCVKLCDSSLSRDLFPADYNCLGDSENRPIKWMSLEALRNKDFSEASDSWAFGVLMWELCTFAKQPYAEVDPFEMEHYLKDGYRLAQPFNCPDELFTIMAYCWALLPIERPLFGQLHVCLSDFYAQITRYV